MLKNAVLGLRPDLDATRPWGEAECLRFQTGFFFWGGMLFNTLYSMAWWFGKHCIMVYTSPGLCSFERTLKNLN